MMHHKLVCAFFLAILLHRVTVVTAYNSYPVTDTSQTSCYNSKDKTTSCEKATPSGQDGAYKLLSQSFCDNQDETVTDMRTGLMWTKNVWGPISLSDASDGISLAGYSDWRVPNIKELYTLSDFDGYTGTSKVNNIPYTNSVFNVAYGTDHGSERHIDGQLWSSTEYVAEVMKGTVCNFGYNPIDGRIKCYPQKNEKFVRYVRGSTEIGTNYFTATDNSEIVKDDATGLEWMKKDTGSYNAGDEGDGTMDWPAALNYCETLSLGGHSDWRLPDAHELQSIVDYTQSPSTTGTAAIDPIFESTGITNEAGDADFGWYWTSTSHDAGAGKKARNAVYIAFGRATGNFSGTVVDVHGAGAQRSDPKEGPNLFPNGHGPQGDIIRINNFARCVRGSSTSSTHAPESCTAREDITIAPTTFCPLKKDGEKCKKQAECCSFECEKKKCVGNQLPTNFAETGECYKDKDGLLAAFEPCKNKKVCCSKLCVKLTKQKRFCGGFLD